MNKKFWAVLLAVVMVIGMLPTAAFADSGPAADTTTTVSAANLYDQSGYFADDNQPNTTALVTAATVEEGSSKNISGIQSGDDTIQVSVKVKTLGVTSLYEHYNAADPKALGHWLGIKIAPSETTGIKYGVFSDVAYSDGSTNDEAALKQDIEACVKASAADLEEYAIELTDGGISRYYKVSTDNANLGYVYVLWLDESYNIVKVSDVLDVKTGTIADNLKKVELVASGDDPDCGVFDSEDNRVGFVVVDGQDGGKALQLVEPVEDGDYTIKYKSNAFADDEKVATVTLTNSEGTLYISADGTNTLPLASYPIRAPYKLTVTLDGDNAEDVTATVETEGVTPDKKDKNTWWFAGDDTEPAITLTGSANYAVSYVVNGEAAQNDVMADGTMTITAPQGKSSTVVATINDQPTYATRVEVVTTDLKIAQIDPDGTPETEFAAAVDCLIMEKGDEDVTLTANVWPRKADDKSVTWSSDREDVVAVDAESGKLTAKDYGYATITASNAYTGTDPVTDTIVVFVPKFEIKDECKDTTINYTMSPTMEMATGGLSTAEFAGYKVEWTSSDAAIVAIDKDSGKVTPLDTGSVTITASVKITNDIILTAETSLKVVDNKTVLLGALSNSELTNGGTVNVTADDKKALGEFESATPSTGLEITWESSDVTIATVAKDDQDEGKWKATFTGKPGEVTFTATGTGTNYDEGKFELTVTVTNDAAASESATAAATKLKGLSADTWTVAAADVTGDDDTAQKAALAAKLKELVVAALNDSSVTVGDPTVTEYAAAGTSTVENAGANGTFKFTVTLTVAGQPQTTDELSGAITAADQWASERAAVAAAKSAIEEAYNTTAVTRDIPMSMANTEETVVEVVKGDIQAKLASKLTGLTLSEVTASVTPADTAAGSYSVTAITITSKSELTDTATVQISGAITKPADDVVSAEAAAAEDKYVETELADAVVATVESSEAVTTTIESLNDGDNLSVEITATKTDVESKGVVVEIADVAAAVQASNEEDNDQTNGITVSIPAADVVVTLPAEVVETVKVNTLALAVVPVDTSKDEKLDEVDTSMAYDISLVDADGVADESIKELSTPIEIELPRNGISDPIVLYVTDTGYQRMVISEIFDRTVKFLTTHLSTFVVASEDGVVNGEINVEASELMVTIADTATFAGYQVTVTGLDAGQYYYLQQTDISTKHTMSNVLQAGNNGIVKFYVKAGEQFVLDTYSKEPNFNDLEELFDIMVGTTGVKSK